MLLISILAVFVYLGLWLVGSPPPGITTLIILSFFGIGLNSFGIGILGEYIGQIYIETKLRPKYIIQEVYQGSAEAELPRVNHRKIYFQNVNSGKMYRF
ncbi:MAG: hypothetical protein IPO22_19075 [Anaerolineales bacterium]|nr:hypothetical protein [Anaerolineales bacterium]